MRKMPKPLLLIAALLLGGVFIFPLWTITLEAPQYPDGISMYIWVNKITGDTESTLQNINILNHYIGMKYIEPDSIPELTYFPYVIVVMMFLGVLMSFIKSRFSTLSWVVVLAVLLTLAIYDFYLWEYDYGHNLDPNAAIKVPGQFYQPPLIGSKMLLNFKSISLPNLGSIFLGLSIFLGFLNYWFEFRKRKRK